MISKPKKMAEPETLQRRLVSMAQAGEIIGYSVDGVKVLIQRGLLPSVRVGRKRLVDLRDLEQLIERSKEIGWTVRPQDRRPHLEG